MKYCNMDLELFDYAVSNSTGEFRVRIAHSPVGDQRLSDSEIVILPPDLDRSIRMLRKRQYNLADTILFGKQLGDSLFPPVARSFLVRSCDRLAPDEGLRIRIKADQPELANIPWEYTYIRPSDTPAGQEGIEGFLVLDRKLSLVRYEQMGAPLVSLDPVQAGAALRMVVLMANSSSPELPHLDLDTDWRSIQSALNQVEGVTVIPYPDATVDTLQDAVRVSTHIFHYSGHAVFRGELGANPRTLVGEGCLALAGDQPPGGLFPARSLALTLADRGVRLAVLGACETALRDVENYWTGVAPALAKQGIPAVIAMQFTVKDRNAADFHRNLYRTLAAGQPVDTAVHDGRLAIANKYPEDRDWGVPVLYLRAIEGVLFPSQPTASDGAVNGPKTTGTAAVTNHPPAGRQMDKRALREKLINQFSSAELEILCADLTEDLHAVGKNIDISIEAVSSTNKPKPSQVLDLIQFCDRYIILDFLAEAVDRARP